MEGSAGQPAVLEVNPNDALAMYGVRMQMPDAPMLRRTFHALVAMFQAAHNCDFYITKYHAKPMAQLQSLFTNIALGLRRLEDEVETAAAVNEPPANPLEERARRTVLKIANAANRSSWCSCCEMACFIQTGALARRTHRPIAIFLSRPLYLYEQCRRLLQSSHEMLIEPQVPYDAQARNVDILCFTASEADRAVLPVDHPADTSDIELAPLGADDETDENDVHSNASEKNNILQDSRTLEDAHANLLEPPSHAQPSESHGAQVDTNSAVLPVQSKSIVTINDENQQHVSKPLDDGGNVEALEDDLNITALEATTSAHDDWLHRGDFLWQMDFHTYIRFTVRKPRPKDHKVTDTDRAEHCFLFDSHYALAASHWQQLVTDGHAKLVVMEALKCPMPNVNNGEDNAVFKSLIGTLLKCSAQATAPTR